MVSPVELQPSTDVVTAARTLIQQTAGALMLTADPREGLKGVDFVYTDAWVSMGEPKHRCAERIKLLSDYQVNADLMALSGRRDTSFMHCLPAFHDRHSEVGEELYHATGRESQEVTDEVFESRQSIVFDQAENRMHAIKAMLVATLER